jgi:hypothetical protein
MVVTVYSSSVEDVILSDGVPEIVNIPALLLMISPVGVVYGNPSIFQSTVTPIAPPA